MYLCVKNYLMFLGFGVNLYVECHLITFGFQCITLKIDLIMNFTRLMFGFHA